MTQPLPYAANEIAIPRLPVLLVAWCLGTFLTVVASEAGYLNHYGWKWYWSGNLLAFAFRDQPLVTTWQTWLFQIQNYVTGLGGLLLFAAGIIALRNRRVITTRLMGMFRLGAVTLLAAQLMLAYWWSVELYIDWLAERADVSSALIHLIRTGESLMLVAILSVALSPRWLASLTQFRRSFAAIVAGYTTLMLMESAYHVVEWQAGERFWRSVAWDGSTIERICNAWYVWGYAASLPIIVTTGFLSSLLLLIAPRRARWWLIGFATGWAVYSTTFTLPQAVLAVAGHGQWIGVSGIIEDDWISLLASVIALVLARRPEGKHV